MPDAVKWTFHAELLRPDDLLHLQVDGSNLRLVRDEDRGPLLTVANDQQPAFLRVTFPPQTIAESAYFEAALVPQKNPPDQPPEPPRAIQWESDPKRKPPDPDQASTDAHAKLPVPGFTAASVSGTGEQKAATVAQMGHPSRLVFVVRAGTKIPFSFAGLLDWSNLDLSVSDIAAIGSEPTAEEIAGAPAIRAPAANETALELPYRLVISPTNKTAWLHRQKPFTSRGRTELWHTRLALKTDKGVVELSKADTASLRAIWSPDYEPDVWPKEELDPHLGRTAMNNNDRHQIVVLTSAFHGYESDEGDLTTRASVHRPTLSRLPYVPKPFYADRLLLTSLGGWLRSHGNWEPPRKVLPMVHRPPDFRAIFKSIAPIRVNPRLEAKALPVAERPIDIIYDPNLFIPPDAPSLDLSEWVHLATQGRDHYVKIVYEGELWPFLHPAALIKVTERKFKEANGVVVAYLMQRMFIVVRKPVMEFASEDRGNILKSVRLTTVVTPDIADPIRIGPTNRSFWVNVMVGPGAQAPFNFLAVGMDVEGNPVDLSGPLMFVSKSDQLNTGALIVEYNRSDKSSDRAFAIPGQKLAFAEVAIIEDKVSRTETTELVTRSLNFIMDANRVQPKLLKASVEIPQVQALLGTDQPTSIRLYDDYVMHGANAPGNRTGVFAEIVDDAYVAFDKSASKATLDLTIAAEKAGGIVTPNMGITTLSRALGPLAGTTAEAVANTFNPETFFPSGGPDTAKLFGTFELQQLFLPVLGGPVAMMLDENAPKMRTETAIAKDGGKLSVTKLEWKPKFLPDGNRDVRGIAKITKDVKGVSILDIKSTLTRRIKANGLGLPEPGEATSVFEGSLNAFEICILESVTIRFSLFSFRKASNEKAKVTVQLDPESPIAFWGDLQFIEEIRNAIPPGLFGDGPSLELIDNPLGIRAGFAFALPPLTVGVFTLKDVKLGAALTLPFLDGKPVFDFNVSERQHPFLLAVAIFGGGGFFHLQLDTAGIKALEVSLEFGATAALDIGVASGEVHIMAGIYFSLQRKEGKTELSAVLSGYLRMGGSLNVLGLICVSVEFNLSFTYDSDKHKAYGRATLTVSVHVLMFSTSVELTVERAFGGSGDPHFIDFFPEPEPWESYALAFA